MQHLTLTSILLSLPLLLSREIGAALKAGHFGFFTEIGFWGQELLMAWCGLAGLIVFWHLVKVSLDGFGKLGADGVISFRI